MIFHHFFHNFNYDEIKHDLVSVFDTIQKINPQIKFLLTVSPVPLTATAVDEHVLTATTYSKSVLRSVAGYLAKTRPDTDYFPSYEIITAAPFKAQFFEDNMRSVKPNGVAFVMRQFLKSIGIQEEINVVGENVKAMAKQPAVVGQAENKKTDSEVCDDIILESWSNSVQQDERVPPKFLLIGDSHMGKLAMAAEEMKLSYVGGGTMNASDWHASLFDLNDEYIFLPKNEDQQIQWKKIVRSTFAKYADSIAKPLIITNLGQQRNEAYFRGFFEDYVQHVYGPDYRGEIKKNELFSYLMVSRAKHFSLMCRFLAKGYQVLVVSDPPFDHREEVVACTLVDKFFVDFYQTIGCLGFNAREWVQQLGDVPTDYFSTDNIHGGDAYYRDLMKEIVVRFKL